MTTKKDTILTQPINYGPMNAHVIGTLLREMMSQAIAAIWTRRKKFDKEVKQNEHKPGKLDYVTDADLAAQAAIVRQIGERFPGYGIVAEEKFRRPCTLEGMPLYFTVDPNDGTNAFERRQSEGFGPMIALCTSDEVIACAIGDAMTSEIYYYRPESAKVHRMCLRDCQPELLVIDPVRKLCDQYVLLRDNPNAFDNPLFSIAQARRYGGLFKEITVLGGGIGVGMARLFKGEVGAYVMNANMQMPWDLMPVWGMSHQLGFIWLAYDEQTEKWFRREIKPSVDPIRFNEPTIVIHGSRRQEFNSWVGQIGAL